MSGDPLLDAIHGVDLQRRLDEALAQRDAALDALGKVTYERVVALMAAAAADDRADQARAERDAARDMCTRLEHAIYKLGAWDPTNPVGREMIREDLERGGAASIERAQ